MKIRMLMMLVSVCTLSAIGCEGGAEDEIPRVVVKGKVTREGQPMPKGRITFYPTQSGPVSGAEINNGEYTVDMNGGVPVGTHIVQFHEMQKPAEAVDRGIPQAENNILPPKFNQESKLQVTFEASAEPIVKDFDLDQEFGPAS